MDSRTMMIVPQYWTEKLSVDILVFTSLKNALQDMNNDRKLDW